jgi:DNA (cytosine-5)-methyltransferase 1
MARNAIAKAPANHDDPGKPHLRNFGSAMREGHGGRRAPTVSSGGADHTPLLAKSVGAADDSYARLLDRELPREAPARNGLTLASFFCCGGGIDLGFRSAGFETVLANDVHRAAADTFEANLGHRPILRDVREVGVRDHAGDPVDVVTGGFPCVTFSMAGRRAGVSDDENGKLYLELCRVIAEFRPRYFVAENVKGMLSANGGQAIKLVLAAFLRLGYRTQYELVNMAEHGVPQTRERVVFVGVRLDEWRGTFAFPRRTHRLAGDKLAAKWLPPAVTLRRAIGDLPPPGKEDRNKYDASRSGAMSAREGHGGRRSPTVLSGGFVPGNNSPLIVGQMYGDSVQGDGKGGFEKKKHTQYSHPRPKGSDVPALPVVSSVANVLVVRQHEANGTSPYAFKQARVVAPMGKPAPTMSTPRQNAPFVEGGVSSHARNDAPVSPNHAMSKRVAHRGRRSPTVVSEAMNVQPLMRDPGGDDVASRNPDFHNPLVPASKPGPTMTAGGQAEVATRGGSLRRMTVRECARVQSFPDWYAFAGSQADGYRIVGNAVPPLYAKRLALALLEYDRRPKSG